MIFIFNLSLFKSGNCNSFTYVLFTLNANYKKLYLKFKRIYIFIIINVVFQHLIFNRIIIYIINTVSQCNITFLVLIFCIIEWIMHLIMIIDENLPGQIRTEILKDIIENSLVMHRWNMICIIDVNFLYRALFLDMISLSFNLLLLKDDNCSSFIHAPVILNKIYKKFYLTFKIVNLRIIISIISQCSIFNGINIYIFNQLITHSINFL